MSAVETVCIAMMCNASVSLVDHTRVILKDTNPEVVGSDYINANYISGEVPGSEKRYIATQGCLPITVDEFWKMVWQENTRVIVMTTNEVERGRVSHLACHWSVCYICVGCFQNKCTRYWPDDEETKVCAKIHIVTLKETSNPHYVLREFLVHHEDDANSDGRVIAQFHFKAWPDHGVPHDAGAVLGFLQDVNLRQSTCSEESQGQEDVGPIIVHCSAGIGRTGTFIVVDILLNLITYQGIHSP